MNINLIKKTADEIKKIELLKQISELKVREEI